MIAMMAYVATMLVAAGGLFMHSFPVAALVAMGVGTITLGLLVAHLQRRADDGVSGVVQDRALDLSDLVDFYYDRDDDRLPVYVMASRPGISAVKGLMTVRTDGQLVVMLEGVE